MDKIVPAKIALADGTCFDGYAFGYKRRIEEAAIGEVVFNTSMYGYQEILTDPSYSGQIMCFTYPHIGNVGCNSFDNESDKVHVEGVLIKKLSPLVSNYRAQEDLDHYLKKSKVMGLAGFDTRMLVSHLRDNGAQMGAMAAGESLSVDDLVDKARSAKSMEGQDLAKIVSCTEPYHWNELPWSVEKQGYPKLSEHKLTNRPHVVAVDCGVKRNILRLLLKSGFRVTVVPAMYNSEQILSLNPDALFLSNGPGDPEPVKYLTKTVSELIGKLPMFGICLGHQILGLAIGAKTYKLKFGHRGGNHPVIDLDTRKVEITVQNHGFAVDRDSLKDKGQVTHVNLNDNTVAGLKIPGCKAFGIQYHPESSPGPHDASYLFDRFYESVVS
ncbi:MAG: glutamine-hydrolyzing carbamoyl-phosphate synthase small subunit [Bdellovibrionales bacterium]|nr:glutamine-hydrolyzing carbamoyl-phosphate synthase small subunit [Bdellovibrionales bacterium]